MDTAILFSSITTDKSTHNPLFMTRSRVSQPPTTRKSMQKRWKRNVSRATFQRLVLIFCGIRSVHACANRISTLRFCKMLWDIGTYALQWRLTQRRSEIKRLKRWWLSMGLLRSPNTLAAYQRTALHGTSSQKSARRTAWNLVSLQPQGVPGSCGVKRSAEWFYTKIYTIWARKYAVSWEVMKQSEVLNPLRRNDLRAFEKKEVVLCICERWRCNVERLRSQNSSVSNGLPPLFQKGDSWVTPLLHHLDKWMFLPPRYCAELLA